MTWLGEGVLLRGSGHDNNGWGGGQGAVDSLVFEFVAVLLRPIQAAARCIANLRP
jgi:hypothetical protein